MSDSDRIEQLRALLSTVVANTKREMAGKPNGSGMKEQKLTSGLLTNLLGRRPSPSEVELAQRY